VDSPKPNSTSGAAWRIGLGAGIAGAILVALKYALRPPTRLRVPDAISPRAFSTKMLHTSLGEVVYHEGGQGRPLLFVHNLGLGSSSYEWARVYPAFAESWRVVALDLVGYGESSRPDLPFVAEDFVQMLAEFIRAREWHEAPIVVASGLGAGLCAQLAVRHPELVSRLILHMPNGTGDVGQHRLTWFSRLIYRTPLLARFLYRNHLSTRAAVAHWLRRAAFVEPALVTEEAIDVFATCAQQPGAEFSAVRWIGGRVTLDLDAEIRALTQPVAFTWGGAVPAAPVELGHHLQRLAGAASLTVFPEAGIMVARETPQEMIAALREQLREDLRVVLKAG
jgi:pimeloyl-ACP methyl ester carboxylesterase